MFNREDKFFEKVFVSIPCPRRTIGVDGIGIKKFPGIAITSVHFGWFDVTHVNSGLKLWGGYERAVNAAISMVDLAHILQHEGIHPSQMNGEAFLNALNKARSENQELNSLILISRFLEGLSEFPWEDGSEDYPHGRLDAVIAKFKEREETDEQ